jgi:hypothetical protein
VASFSQDISVTAKAIDRDLQFDQSLGINYTWSCVNYNLNSPCTAQNGSLISSFVQMNLPTISIPKMNLAPYQTYTLRVNATKDIRWVSVVSLVFV